MVSLEEEEWGRSRKKFHRLGKTDTKLPKESAKRVSRAGRERSSLKIKSVG